MILGYWNILGLKSCAKKNDNIHKDFELHQVLMHNFLYKNAPILPLYILLKIGQDCKQNLNNNNFSQIILYAELSQNPHFT